MTWNDLSLSDKARMIELAVKSGITNLRDIQDVYNTYASGGHIRATGGPEGDPNILNSRRYNAKQEEAMWSYLINSGLNEAQAAGVLGNMAVESYLNADIQQQHDGPAYGLIQAEAGRQRAMRNFNDVPYLFGSKLSPEEQQQLDYVLENGIKNYTIGEWGRKGFSGARQARQAFINSNDVNEASDIFTYNYLRPGKPQVNKRRRMSNYYYNKYKKPYFVSLNELEK